MMISFLFFLNFNHYAKMLLIANLRFDFFFLGTHILNVRLYFYILCRGGGTEVQGAYVSHFFVE